MLKTALQKATAEGVSPNMYDRLRATLGPLAGQAGELGDADDLKLHRTLDRGFAKRLDKSSERILRLARSMVEAVDKNKTAGSSKAKASKVRQKLQEEDDVVHEFTPNVQDTIDGLLEATVSIPTSRQSTSNRFIERSNYYAGYQSGHCHRSSQSACRDCKTRRAYEH
jgi:hypothetical protein